MVLFGASASLQMESFTSLGVRMVPSNCGRTAKDPSVCGKQMVSNRCHVDRDSILGGVLGVIFEQRMHRFAGSFATGEPCLESEIHVEMRLPFPMLCNLPCGFIFNPHGN